MENEQSGNNEKSELDTAIEEAVQAGMTVPEIVAEIKKTVSLTKPKIIEISCEPVL